VRGPGTKLSTQYLNNLHYKGIWGIWHLNSDSEMLNAKFCRSNLVVEQIESIPYITNMWQVYMRLNSASDFYVRFCILSIKNFTVKIFQPLFLIEKCPKSGYWNIFWLMYLASPYILISCELAFYLLYGETCFKKLKFLPFLVKICMGDTLRMTNFKILSIFSGSWTPQ
jgi:hypothetical protein